MRKIDELVRQKFWNYDPTQKQTLSDNTKIEHSQNQTKLYLFGNLIATNDIKYKTLIIDFKGYITKTTKNRLNAVLSEINQHIKYVKKIPLLNDRHFIPRDNRYNIHY